MIKKISLRNMKLGLAIWQLLMNEEWIIQIVVLNKMLLSKCLTQQLELFINKYYLVIIFKITLFIMNIVK